jgi:hypothetical protein
MMTVPTDRERRKALFWLLICNKLLKWSLKCAYRSGCGMAIADAYVSVLDAIVTDSADRRIVPFKTVQHMKAKKAELGL